MTVRALVASLAAAALLAGGCGSDDDDEPEEPLIPPATTQQAPPEEEPGPATSTALDGRYAATITRADVRRYPKLPVKPGRWRLTIVAPTMYSSGPDGGGEQLQFQMDGDIVVTAPKTNCTDRRGRQTGGRYRATQTPDGLRFKAIREPCGDHAFTLTSATWRAR